MTVCLRAMTDITAVFREAVRRRRGALGLATPVDELMRTSRPRSAFAAGVAGLNLVRGVHHAGSVDGTVRVVGHASEPIADGAAAVGFRMPLLYTTGPLRKRCVNRRQRPSAMLLRMVGTQKLQWSAMRIHSGT